MIASQQYVVVVLDVEGALCRPGASVTSTVATPWTLRLSAERIEPGATHGWSTWITARGQNAKGTATLGCDQAR
jgi:hypothetical protein